MPIVNIEIVGEKHRDDRAHLAQELADEIDVLLSSRPQGTWVKIRYTTRPRHQDASPSAAPS